jgi:AcrR family transcriptional regulator
MADSALVAAAGVRRPARADAARNFDALLAAARVAFARHGPGASLEDIARDAAVGIGTLYRNFPTRQHLYNSIYVEEIDQLCAVAGDAADLPPWDAMVLWLRRFVGHEVTKRAMHEGIDRDSPMFHAGRDAMFAAGEPLLRRAQDADAVRADVSLGDVLRMIIGITRSAFDDDAQFERVLGMALDGLRPRQGSGQREGVGSGHAGRDDR